MKVTQHGKHLWKLTRLLAFNNYLVGEEDGLTVVDTGLSGSAEDILKAAAAIGRPIIRITLTHAHGDHVGSLDELVARLEGVEIAFTQRTADFLSGDLALKEDEPQAELRGSFVSRTTRPARLLTHGDKLGSLRAVASPGHTPDHIAFLDERDGTLIAGDTFQTQGGIAVSGVLRWSFPFPSMATWHQPTALESARALRDLKPSRLAVGHGRVLENPLAQMDQAIAVAGAKFHG